MPLIIKPQKASTESDTEKQYREAAQAMLVHELQQFPLVFKGGTALRLLHGSKRFSEDLDFDLSLEMSDEERQVLTEKIRQHLYDKEERWTRDKKINGSEETFNYYFRAHYKIESNRPKSIKIEISRYKPTKNIQLVSLVNQPNADALKVRTYGLDILMTGKLNAIFTRHSQITGKRTLQGRDLYDFIQFGQNRSITWKLLDDYRKNEDWLPRKIKELVTLFEENKHEIVKDIQDLLPSGEQFNEESLYQFLDVMKTLNFPKNRKTKIINLIDQTLSIK